MCHSKKDNEQGRILGGGGSTPPPSQFSEFLSKVKEKR